MNTPTETHKKESIEYSEIYFPINSKSFVTYKYKNLEKPTFTQFVFCVIVQSSKKSRDIAYLLSNERFICISETCLALITSIICTKYYVLRITISKTCVKKSMYCTYLIKFIEAYVYAELPISFEYISVSFLSNVFQIRRIVLLSRTTPH